MVEAASDWVRCVVMYSDESDLVLEIRNPQAHLPRSQLPSHGVCVPVPLPLSRSQLPSHGVRGSESGSALGETPGAIYCSHSPAPQTREFGFEVEQITVELSEAKGETNLGSTEASRRNRQ